MFVAMESKNENVIADNFASDNLPPIVKILNKLPKYIQDIIAAMTEEELTDVLLYGALERGKNLKEKKIGIKNMKSELFGSESEVIEEEIKSVSFNKFQTDKTCSSYDIGKIGEEKIREFICQRYEIGEQKNKSGDIKIIGPKIRTNWHPILVGESKQLLHPVIIEVKNYNLCVPKKEIDKFKRDLEYTNAGGGLIISLRSGFSKKEKNILTVEKLSISGTNIPVMFLSMENIINVIIAEELLGIVIDYIILLAHNTRNYIGANNGILVNINVLEGVLSQINNLCRDLSIMASLRINIEEMQTAFSKSIMHIYRELQSFELRSYQYINCMRELLEPEKNKLRDKIKNDISNDELMSGNKNIDGDNLLNIVCILGKVMSGKWEIKPKKISGRIKQNKKMRGQIMAENISESIEIAIIDEKIQIKLKKYDNGDLEVIKEVANASNGNIIYIKNRVLLIETTIVHEVKNIFDNLSKYRSGK